MPRMPANLLQFCHEVATTQQGEQMLGESNIEKMYLYVESCVLGYYQPPPNMGEAYMPGHKSVKAIQFDPMEELNEHEDINHSLDSPLLEVSTDQARSFLLACQTFWQAQLKRQPTSGLQYKLSRIHYYLGFLYNEDKNFSFAIEQFKLALAVLIELPVEVSPVYYGAKVDCQTQIVYSLFNQAQQMLKSEKSHELSSQQVFEKYFLIFTEIKSPNLHVNHFMQNYRLRDIYIITCHQLGKVCFTQHDLGQAFFYLEQYFQLAQDKLTKTNNVDLTEEGYSLDGMHHLRVTLESLAETKQIIHKIAVRALAKASKTPTLLGLKDCLILYLKIAKNPIYQHKDHQDFGANDIQMAETMLSQVAEGRQLDSLSGLAWLRTKTVNLEQVMSDDEIKQSNLKSNPSHVFSVANGIEPKSIPEDHSKASKLPKLR